MTYLMETIIVDDMSLIQGNGIFKTIYEIDMIHDKYRWVVSFNDLTKDCQLYNNFVGGMKHHMSFVHDRVRRGVITPSSRIYDILTTEQATEEVFILGI